MGRVYNHCRNCHARMRLFDKDASGERRFYLCGNCGQRETYNVRLNGLAEEWPPEIFQKAVEQGVVTPKGRVVGR